MSSNNFYFPLREQIATMHNETKNSNVLNDSREERVHNNLNNRNPQSPGMLMTPTNTNQNRTRSQSPTVPLLNMNPNAPLANIETDEEADDREVVNRPYPGVDDGFFTNGVNEGRNNRIPTQPQDSGNPDVELVPTRPRDPEETEHEIPHVPGVSSRAGSDGDSVNPDDKTDLNPVPADVPKLPPPASNPDFPFRPWGWDLEVGSTLPSGETIPDLNVYQHKKTLAQGMMDLALFSANANQLRYVLETFKNHPYYYPSVVLIALSLLLQVGVGIGLVWNATFNVRNQKDLCTANKINNFTIIGVFLVTVINVFISAFGVAPAQP